MKSRALMTVMLAVVAACARSEQAAVGPQEIAFTATDFAFTGPDTIAPGVTTIRMDNHGESSHHIILGQFAEGHGVPDLMAFIQANPGAEPSFMTWRGATGTAGPHASSGSTMDLPAGHYVLLCFVPDAQGMPHILHGMMRELTVTGTRHAAALPEAGAVIRMLDFAYVAPSMSAGTHTFRIVNDGPQTHEVQLLRLHDGATIEQVFAAFAPGAAGPPPADEIGGSGALSPGVENYWTVDLAAGNYALVCFVPDVADGVPHAMKGMVYAFSIAAN